MSLSTQPLRFMQTYAMIMLPLAIALFASSQCLYAEEKQVIRYLVAQHNTYGHDLLQLALEKTESTDGSFVIKSTLTKMGQDRGLQQILPGKSIDITQSMTSIEREQQYLPIRIPIHKGLLGHRVFIIRKEDRHLFQNIHSIEGLKGLKAGLAHDWPDTKILRANGLNVVAGQKYQNLFSMLKIKRFDYFPRGINEVWTEVQSPKLTDLVVEETILLHYPAPEYFFVNKKNIKLANRIEMGLRIAINDGSFDELFMNHPTHTAIFNLTDIKNRKVIQLKNPLLPLATPLEDKALWYTIEDRLRFEKPR